MLLFGANGRSSNRSQVDHVGIDVAPGRLVHSSRDGVTLTPFAGWYRGVFAWGQAVAPRGGLTDTAAG